MGYGDTYISGVSNTLQRQGDAMANARLRQGDITAHTIGQLGQIASALPAQVQEAQQAAQVKQELGLATQLAQANLGPDGQPNWSIVAGELKKRNPLSQIAAEIEKRAQEQQKTNATVQNTQSEVATREANLVLSQNADQRAADKAAADAAAAKAAQDRADAIKGILQKHADPQSGIITDWKPAIDELAAQGYRQEAKDFADLAKVQQPEKVTFGAPTPAVVNGRKVFVRTGSDGQTYDMKGQPIAVEPTPIEPKAAEERLVQIMGPDGVPVWVREGQAVGQPAAQAARAVTGAERQALSFYNRAKDAVDTLALPDDKGRTLEQRVAESGLMTQAGMKYLPNIMQSDDQQAYTQAQRAFTEARLRKESGAAIPESEFENDRKTYFAQPGDSKSTIEQKRQKREKLLEGMGYSAGKAYEEFYGEKMPKIGGAIKVTAPDGSVHEFATQAQADAFKKLIGGGQ